MKIQVPGKWVLAGEHSVLRGGSAVALPHPEFSLTLEFSAGGEDLVVHPSDAEKAVREMLEGVTAPRGELRISSTIPIGAGLGSSAALCVAAARWLGVSDEIAFATQLEHRFHGKSSGMDVAVISNGVPVAFSMAEGPRVLKIARMPRFTFHDTGVRSSTRPCIEQVERFKADQPERARVIDEQMDRASGLAQKGLVTGDIEAVAESMRLAHECFEAWGLVPVEARRLIEGLRREGALAGKITGAGGGGFVIALWPNV